MSIETHLPWLMSAVTIWMTLLAGNKHKSAWLVGLANQALWLSWIVATATWGLIPMNIALWIVYARNHWRWQAEQWTDHDGGDCPLPAGQGVTIMTANGETSFWPKAEAVIWRWDAWISEISETIPPSARVVKYRKAKL